MAKRTHRSAEQWQAIVDTQQHSGLSARDFCRENDLGYASFINWRRRLVDREASPSVLPPASFIELTPTGGVRPVAASASEPAAITQNSTTVTIELSLGHGLELRITRAA